MVDRLPPETADSTEQRDESRPDGHGTLSRRTVLKAAAGSATVTGLAGCQSGGSDSTPSPADGTSTQTTPIQTVGTPDCESYTSLSQSDVNGGVTLSAGCYRIESVHTVDSGTLTLEPGVHIEFAANAGLAIASGGALSSKGTAQKPVVLRGQTAERAHWKGIEFAGTGSSSLQHTLVAHAGSELWTGDDTTKAALFVRSGSVDVGSVTLRDNAGRAVLAKTGDADLSIAETVFESNEIPVRLHPNLLGGFAASNVVEGNDDDRVTVLGGTETARDEIATDQEWHDPGVPVYVPQDVRLTATLTVGEGTTVEFGEQKGLDVTGGHLVVEGTGSDPVRFRGATSDRGFWQGIRLRETTAANALQHAIVRDAGGQLWHGADYSKAGVFVEGSDVRLTLDRCTIANNDVCGVTATGNGAEFLVENCSFEQNVEPLRVTADLVGGLAPNNAYAGNDGSYVRVGIGGARTTVNRDATWPARNVPYRLDRNLRVNADLEIGPGTTLEAGLSNRPNRTVKIRVPKDSGGSLNADASASEEPIRFTGTVEEPGHWGGIDFETANSNNVLRNVVVEYAGGELATGDLESKACLAIWASGVTPSVTLEQVTLGDSAQHGIYKGCAATISCGDLSFENIAGANIWDAGEDAPVSGCSPTC